MTLSTQQSEALGGSFDPARVRRREGPGGKELSYLAGHDVIRQANKIFGYGGWGYHVRELTHIGTERYESRNNQKMVRIAYRCVVVVFVDGAQDTSGVGYGDSTERYYPPSNVEGERALERLRAVAADAEAMPVDGQQLLVDTIKEALAYTIAGEGMTSLTAHELAIKESETDAVKRALKNYGDQFGLALYDEERRKMLEGSATDEEVYAAIKELVELGAEETVVRESIAGQREKYDGLLPRGWLQRQVQRAKGAEEPPPDMPYG